MVPYSSYFTLCTVILTRRFYSLNREISCGAQVKPPLKLKEEEIATRTDSRIELLYGQIQEIWFLNYCDQELTIVTTNESNERIY